MQMASTSTEKLKNYHQRNISKNLLDNITTIINTLEDKYIKCLQALTLNGFIFKLNHPQKIALKEKIRIWMAA